MRIHFFGCLFAIVFLMGAAGPAPAAEYRIKVSAGDVDRHGSVVSVPAPPNQNASAWKVVLDIDPDDVHPNAVVGPHGQLMLPLTLKARQTASFTLTPVDSTDPSGVSAKPTDDGRVEMKTVAGQPFFLYQGKPGALPEGYEQAFLRGGYIQSVFTPSGLLISDDFPPDHKHHHGIWSPWTKTTFEGRKPDFWNMGAKTGRVEFVSHDTPWSNGLVAGFSAKHTMVDLTAQPTPRNAINERWDVVVYGTSMGEKPANVFDLVITQTCATDSPLILPKYHYGGLGFRGARGWKGKTGTRFLTSEGKTRVNGNETRAKWCYIGGDVDGKPAGLAILCHPDNFRFPQPVRIHPDEPFFCFAPSQLGDWKIEPGKPYVAKYRFVVSDGKPDAKEIERLWRDYAEPVKVEVLPAKE